MKTQIFRALAIVGTAATVAAAGLAPQVAAAQTDGPKVNWKYNVWGKERAFTVGVRTIADHVEEKTGGNFKIKIFYGDQLGGKKENLDNLKAGAFEMAQICSSYHPDKNASLMVLNLPFLPIPNADVEIAVHEAVYAHPIVQAELKDKWNVMPIMSSILPQYEFLGKGDAPTGIDGFKGMSVRALGGVGDAMEKLGASKNTVTATEVYQAIDRGTVQAASFPFSYAHVSYKINEVATWFTTNLAPGTSDCPTVVSLDAWNELPPEYQALIMEAKPAAYEALKAAYAAADEKNIPMFEKTMTPVTFSEEDLTTFRGVGGQPVWDAWIEDNKDAFDSKGLFDTVMDAAKKAGG